MEFWRLHRFVINFQLFQNEKERKHTFHATVDLKQFEEVEKEHSYQEGSGEISLGTYEIEENLEDEIGSDRHYTKIIMEDIKEGFRNKLIQEDKKRFRITEKAATSNRFEEFINDIKHKRLNEIAQYDQLIWELGLLCPVEYIENGPLPNNMIIRKEVLRLKNYDFKVFVDGFEISKPIKFPTSEELKVEDADYKIYPRISYDKQMDGTRLRFVGYLFHQRKRILPAELQGILIRIKGVAVGTYDKAFLHYPKAEGPMPNQLSGEIDVEEGLEEALNIDRNSFNETHQHYLCLQKFLWDYLGGDNGVFKDIRRRSKERQDTLRKKESRLGLDKMQKIIKDMLGLDIKVVRKNIKGETLYVFDKREKNLILFSNSFWSRNQKEKLIQEKIILAVVAAKEKSNSIDTFEKNFLLILSRGK